MSKFKIGDMVTYKPESGHSRNAAHGAYEVTAIMSSEREGLCDEKEKDAVYSLATPGEIAIGATSDCVSSRDCTGQLALD